MRLCLSIASWLLAAGLPAAGFVSGSFPMEGGDLQRSNTALAPSSVEGPLEAAWSTTLPALGGDTRGNPLLLPDRALVVRDGSLTAIRRSDGSLLYSVSTLSSAATGSLDLVRGLIYLNGHQGTLAAYRTSDGGLAWSKAEPALAGAANRGSSLPMSAT
jgi:outer membrane protein assembly factor BamB